MRCRTDRTLTRGYHSRVSDMKTINTINKDVIECMVRALSMIHNCITITTLSLKLAQINKASPISRYRGPTSTLNSSPPTPLLPIRHRRDRESPHQLHRPFHRPTRQAPKPHPIQTVHPRLLLPLHPLQPPPRPPSAAPPPPPPRTANSTPIAASAFGSPTNTLTEPVWDTVKRDLARIVSNLKLVVFPNPFREDPGKALRDWDLWGPFFFIVFLGLTLSWSASVKKISKNTKAILGELQYIKIKRINPSVTSFTSYGSPSFSIAKKHHLCLLTGRYIKAICRESAAAWLCQQNKGCVHERGERGRASEVFAVAFALLAAGAIILTLNVLLLGGHIIFFQSLSLLGYCLFPLDIGALICMLKDNVIVKLVVVCVTLAWSSWAAYPFMSAAVNPRRKALALYPVFLMYISVGFLIIAID
ncbi:hypothetical protein Syun_008945 [Stephania yunnanensis]|uniref:Yip1 domain-containing protein n=1 Tax=Stephania yunnanensis TaxID=152371 RepID=A0AAP0KDG8_9MAGN